VLREASARTGALRYVLKVYRGARESHPTDIILKFDQGASASDVEDTSSQGYLTNFTLSLMSVTGEKLGSSVKYYEPVVIQVETELSDVSWTYDLISPPSTDFMTAANMILGPTYYSPDTVPILNRKALGIGAFALSPMTNYTFQVTFKGSADFKDTAIFVSFSTVQKPNLVLPNPSDTAGTPDTIFTATAGIAFNDNLFLYYFNLVDETGESYCVGGCTGYGVTYFRIGRVGSYQLSVNLVEARGRALMQKETFSQAIVITESTTGYDIYKDLGRVFVNGDDSSYTQGALDLALAICVNMQSASSATRFTESLIENEAVLNQGFSNEIERYDVFDQQASSSERAESGSLNATATSPVYTLSKEEMNSDMLLAIANGLRSIFCASFPTSGHSALGVKVATMLAKCPHLPQNVVYDLMWTVQCCLEKSPKGTITDVPLQDLVQQLHRVAMGMTTGSRRRLLQAADVSPNNLIADLQIWGGPAVTISSVSGKLAGHSSVTTVNDGFKTTNFSVLVAENAGQLPSVRMDGNNRKGVLSGGGAEYSDRRTSVFYTQGQCTSQLFNLTSDNIFLTLQTTPNFITTGNFQDSPPLGNLAYNLTWMRAFMYDPNGRVVEVIPSQANSTGQAEACFCFRVPIVNLTSRQELKDNLELAPTLYFVTTLKEFEVNATSKGEFFRYDTDGAPNATAYDYDNYTWVEGCVAQLGIVAPTFGTPRSAGPGSGAQLSGLSTIGIVGILISGLVFVVAAVVTSWVIATRAMAVAEIPPELGPDAHQLYVERDIYGRGTIFESYGNASSRGGEDADGESSVEPDS
jgi:hypothetical protein